MKISTLLFFASTLSPIAAAPGEEGMADAPAMDMSMPAMENVTAGPEPGKEALAQDDGKGGKDEGKDAAAVAPADNATAAPTETAPTETVKTEPTNATSDASGNSTDALSASSASDIDSYFAVRTLGVAAVATGLWF
ncbi:hypothetical protein ACHAW6_014337 [Cyclotella cf. meneghiniana]